MTILKYKKFTFAMITSFFRTLIAYSCPEIFSRHKMTFPNVPLPRTFKNSKLSNVQEKENSSVSYTTLYVHLNNCIITNIFYIITKKDASLNINHTENY